MPNSLEHHYPDVRGVKPRQNARSCPPVFPGVLGLQRALYEVIQLEPYGGLSCLTIRHCESPGNSEDGRAPGLSARSSASRPSQGSGPQERIPSCSARGRGWKQAFIIKG